MSNSKKTNNHLCLFLFLLCLININTAKSQMSIPAGIEHQSIILNKPDTNEIHSLIEASFIEADIPAKQNIDSSLQMLRMALDRSKAIGYNRGAVRALTLISRRHLDQGRYDSSIYYARQSYSYIVRGASYSDKSAFWVFDILSKNYFLKGNYPLSAYYGYKAHEELKYLGLKDFELLAQVYTTLFMCAQRLRSEKAVAYYFNLAKNATMRSNDSASIAVLYTNRASTDFSSRNWDSSEKYYLAAMDIASRHKKYNASLETVASINLAMIYVSKNIPRLAIEYAERALELNKATGNIRNEIDAFSMLGFAYYGLKDYRQAERYALHALDLAKPLGHFDNLDNVYEILIRIYERQGKYEQALKYYRAKNMIKDSLLSITRFKSLGELEAKYKSTEKDKDIAEKNLLIVRQANALRKKNIWIGGVSFGIVFLVTLSTVVYRSNKQKQRLQLAQIEKLEQEQHIQKLEAIIKGEEKERTRMARELHDGVVSQLASVKWNLDATQKEYEVLAFFPYFKNAINQLDDATIELRNTAHNLLPGMIVEQSLTEAVAHFCNKVCKSGLSIDFHASGADPVIDADFKLSIYRMVQELVQNIIKHAAATQAIVQIDYKDLLLVVTVEDNGRGFDTARATNGIGLKNIEERTKAMNGRYYIESNWDGTSIHLEFDISTLQNH